MDLVQTKPLQRRRKLTLPKIRKGLLGVLLILLFLLVVVLPLTFFSVIDTNYGDKVYDLKSVPEARIALVFVLGSDTGNQKQMLEDTLTTAAELYKQGKVQKLVVNYDDGSGVNEIELKNLIYQKGVRDFDYQLNRVEEDTYAACYLDKEQFGVQSAILVTQEINIIRDIYTCNAIGIDAWGVISDRSLYQDQDSLPVQIYKLFSSFWKIYVSEPDLIIGDKINL